MWKQIQIAQLPYWINCNFSEDGQQVSLVLYDQNDSWCESLSFVELKRKVKLLNRRYEFSETNIRDTLLRGEQESAALELKHNGNGPGCSRKKTLRLKYRVKNCPFVIDWDLQKQTMLEFQQTVVKPLCSTLSACYEQIQILTDCLKKKDAEILQYRKEGAILSRKTLATKLFDFEEFSKKYEAINNSAALFTEYGKCLNNVSPQKQSPSGAEKKAKDEELKTEKKETNSPTKKPPTTAAMSPGQRKRKIENLRESLAARKRCIEYDSSQSQSQSSTTTGNSQSPTEEAIVKPKAKEQNEKTLEQKSLAAKSNAVDKTVADKKTDETARKDASKDDTKKAPIIAKTKSPPTSPTKLNVQKAPRKPATCMTSDSDSDDVVLTPGKKLLRSSATTKKVQYVVDSDTESDTLNIRKQKQSESSTKQPPINESNVRKSQRILRHLNFDEVVEVSDDSESSKDRRYPQRRHTTNTPTKRKEHQTQFNTPQSEKSHVNGKSRMQTLRRRNSLCADLKIFESSPKSLKKPPMDDITSQLDTIRKELESLEALRLADLEKRKESK